MSKTTTSNHDKGISEKNAVESLNFERKLDLITAGSRPYIKRHLLERLSRENCNTIINYILAFQTEVSPSESYRLDTIETLKKLSTFHENKKLFHDMTRQDIIDFLDRLRKPETLDPTHQWKGSYEINRVILLRFFKWLYSPDSSANKRPKPAVVENIPRINRKEKTVITNLLIFGLKKTMHYF